MESFDSPPALRPIYSTSEPNQPIELYQGSLEITQNGTVIKGNGNLCIQWLPSPEVRFEFLSHDDQSNEISTNESEASLKLLDLTTPVSVEVYILSFSLFPLSSENSISGCLRKEAVISQPEQELSHVLFHLSNFDDFRGTGISTTTSFWYGRVILEAEGWRVTIDSIKTAEKSLSPLNLREVTLSLM